jgi:hypothetical protein
MRLGVEIRPDRLPAKDNILFLKQHLRPQAQKTR